MDKINERVVKRVYSGTVRLATRGSALALWQADRVAELIARYDSGICVEKIIVSTKPDRVPDRPLSELGGNAGAGDKGLFVKEVEQAVLDGRADAAVHSLKDVPVEDETPGLTLAAFPERADPRDVLLSRGGEKLENLPAGSVVATSAPRRQAQLLSLRPDLKVCDVRGNVETRVRKLRDGEFDAIIMAAAGLRRLGMQEQITEFLSVDDFVPAPGQGIVVVQAVDDSEWAKAWRAVDNAEARLAAETEREFSRLIGATCYTAAGCLLEVLGDQAIFHATVLSPDGKKRLRFSETADVIDVVSLAKIAAESFIKQGCKDF